MLVEFTRNDLLQSKIVTPAWYRVRINEVDEKASKDGQSTNLWIRGEILFEADNGSTEFQGVPTPFPWILNSKGAWAMVGFAAALGQEVKEGSRSRFDKESLVGKEIDMFIENGLYEGNIKNVCNNKYRAPKVG